MVNREHREIGLNARLGCFKCYVGTYFHFFVEFIFDPLNWNNFTVDECEIFPLTENVAEVNAQPMIHADCVIESIKLSFAES